jgi:hypothetical protein
MKELIKLEGEVIIMCKTLEEVNAKIEVLRQFLNDGILSNASEQDIMELNQQIDKLIVLHYRLQEKYKNQNKY